MKAHGGVGIAGVGKYLPKHKITNKDLAKRLGISADWILKRTGIRNRHFAQGKEHASWISAKASEQALRRSGIKAKELGLVIACTSSGDYVFPATACKVQDLLGARHAGAFDLQGSASGFPITLGLASDRLRMDPGLKPVLVVGTAIQSPYIDKSDAEISILLGDASAAAVLSHVPPGYGVLASEVISHGHYFEAARMRGGGSRFPLGESQAKRKLQSIEIDGVILGREFLKHQPLLIRQALEKAGLKMADVDLFLFHQANLRLIQFLMDRLKLPMSKTFTNVERVGNTADASLPLALCEAFEQGRVKRGDLVVLSGVGAGCVLSVTVLRWY